MKYDRDPGGESDVRSRPLILRKNGESLVKIGDGMERYAFKILDI